MEDMTPEGAHRELDRALGNLDEPRFDVLHGQLNPDDVKLEDVKANLGQYIQLAVDNKNRARTGRIVQPSHVIKPEELIQIPKTKKLQEDTPESKESFDSMEDAVLASVDNRRLNKEEIINEILGKRSEIEIRGGDRIARLSIGIAINNLLRENKLVDSDGKGNLRVSRIVGGGSTNESSKKPERPEVRWSVPEAFESELNTMILSEHGNPYTRRALDVFRQFDVATAHSVENLKLKLKGQRASGTFTEEQYKKLLNILEMSEVISGELPYPEGFVAEPPPVVPSYATFPRQTPKKIPEPVAVKPSIVVDHPPITPDYIREHGIAYGADKTKTDDMDSQVIDLPEPPPVVPSYAVFPRQNPRVKPAPVEIKPSLVNHTVITRADLDRRAAEQSSITPDVEETYPSAEVDDTPSEPLAVSDPQSRVKSLNERMSEAVVRAQGVEMSKAAVEKFSTTQYEEPIGPLRKEDLSPEESARIEGEMRQRLDVTREKLAAEEVAYKGKVREGKKVFRSIMNTLAPGRQRPLPEKELEHKEAEKAYLDAKWDLRNFISGRDIKNISSSDTNSLLGQEKTTHRIDVGVLKQAEKEYSLLQERILEMTPQKEKKIIERAFEKWNSIPLAQRVILSSALLTAGGVALGTVGVSGALATLGWRAGRAFVGTSLGLKAGQLYGNAKNKELGEKRTERLNEYGAQSIREKDQFVEEEKGLERFFTQEKKDITKNQLKKAAITTAVAGVSTVGLGLGSQALVGETVPSGGKIPTTVDSTPTPKTSWLDKLIKPNPEVKVSSPDTLKFGFKGYEPVAVNLSNNGFIDTVAQLKENLHGHALSPAVEKLFTQSPEKVAMDLGLYKPGQVAESAFGLKGEQLTMNANGDIAIMHNDGSVNILFNAEGKITQFGEYAGNTMFDADKLATSAMPKEGIEPLPSIKPPVVAEVGSKSVHVPTSAEAVISAATPAGSIVADSAVVGTSLSEVPTSQSIDFERIVVSHAEPVGPQDMVVGKLPLKPEYQFDPKFKAQRVAYNIRLEKELMNIPQDMFDLRYPIEYNGGRINVFQKGEDITILLNGQKIGTGRIVDGKIGFQYEQSLGKGMLGVKNDFEQAFEKARVEVEKNERFFKVKK